MRAVHAWGRARCHGRCPGLRPLYPAITAPLTTLSPWSPISWLGEPCAPGRVAALSHPDSVPDHSAPPAASYFVLGSLWLLVFTSASQAIIITPILPLIGDALSIPAAWRGALQGVYSWALAASALFAGPISDRVGRRRMLLVGSGAMAATLAAHGLADSFEGFLSVRVLAGICGGALSGAAVSYVGDAFPSERRGWATGLVMSGVPFGLVLGIPVGRVLAASMGFRLPFLAFALLMGAAFLLMLRFLVQPPIERETAKLGLLPALRRYRALMREPGVVPAIWSFVLMYGSLSLLITYLPQWLTDRFSLDIQVFGHPLAIGVFRLDFIASLFLVGGIVSVIASPKAGSLSDRIGRKPLILVSCVGLSITMLLLVVALRERWMAYPFYCAIMGFFALRMSPFQALMTELVSGRLRGTLLALSISAGQIAFGAGSFLAGALYTRYGFASNALAATVSVVAMAAVVHWKLPETRRNLHSTEP